ncbi:MAG: hypothetical protein DHS20C20_18050 [Ardenticatenaceae bacterium]|nr:MAG: hypothetical protein DHS20C20_18050 [Ardenticatenaceae bacterium]
MKPAEKEAEVIDIQDAALDQAAIRQRVAEALATRKKWQDVAHAGPESLRAGKTAVPLAATETLNRLMIDLMAQEPLHERPFTSDAPLIGPLIVAFRNAWNWVSTRWYVLPIMQQQIQINQQMQLVINELTQRQELDARRIAQLEARLEKEETT